MHLILLELTLYLFVQLSCYEIEWYDAVKNNLKKSNNLTNKNLTVEVNRADLFIA